MYRFQPTPRSKHHVTTTTHMSRLELNLVQFILFSLHLFCAGTPAKEKKTKVCLHVRFVFPLQLINCNPANLSNPIRRLQNKPFQFALHKQICTGCRFSIGREPTNVISLITCCTSEHCYRLSVPITRGRKKWS